jgi:hypothetical protein
MGGENLRKNMWDGKAVRGAELHRGQMNYKQMKDIAMSGEESELNLSGDQEIMYDRKREYRKT